MAPSARLAPLGALYDDPDAVPPGFTGYVAPVTPTGVPVPIYHGEGFAALGDIALNAGTGLADMGRRTADLYGRLRSGDIDPAAFSRAVASHAAGSLYDTAASAVTAPRDAISGALPVFGPDGHVTDEAMNRAGEMAGLAMTGSMPFKAPAGAIRSFGGGESLDDLLASMSSAIDQHAGSVAPDVRSMNRVDPQAASWDLYHGTNAPTDFARFDPNLPKAQRGHTPGSETGGVFLSPAADEAAQYSGSIGGRAGAEAGPRVIRTTVDPGKTDVFDLPYLMEHDPSFIARARQTTIDDAGGRQAAGQMFDERHARMLDEFQSARDLNKQLAEMGYPATEVPQVQWGYGATGAAMQMARERGLDTAVLRGLSESNGGDQVVALTPGRVRSYYDPDHVLYSGGPGGAAVGSAALASPSPKAAAMENPFDQFDAPSATSAPAANPFDQFDEPAKSAAVGPQSATDLVFGGEDAPADTPARDMPMGRLTSAPTAAYAAASSALDGIPVVGPALTGASNRLAAGIRSLRSGDPYATELQRIEDYDAGARAAHPVAATAGEVAGAIGGTAPALMAAPALFGAGTAALPIRAGLSMATGGAMGAADTAARGGDAKQIEHGAELGLGLGFAAPALGAVAGKVAGAVAERATGGQNRLLNRALTADGLTPETAQAALADLGDAGMLADLGPNLQRQAGALAAIPGEGQRVVRGAIADRMAGASGRTTEAADRALGQPVDALSTMDRLIQERADAAAPAYLEAYIQPMPENGRVKAALNTPAGQAAWKKAETLAANEGIPLDVTKPTVRAIDLTKRALDDMVSSAQRGGNNNEARVIGGVRNLLVSGVDAVVPQYAAARQAFASHTALQDAFEAGQSLFDKAITPGHVARTLNGMTDGERALHQEGVRAALADLMGTARNDALKARQVFDQGYNREKLGQVIGREQAEALIGDLNNEATFARTRDVVTGNSETAARAAAMQEIEGGGGSGSEKAGIIKNLLDLKFGTAAAGVGKKVTQGIGDALRERRNADLAQILMESGPDRAGAQRAFAAISRSVRAKDITSDAASKLMQAVVRGGGQQALGGLAGLPAR